MVHQLLEREHCMKSFKYLLVGVLLLQCNSSSANEITYIFSGGRFGDNLIAYLHAKWVAHKHGLKLLYKPFPYSDQLVLHEQEARFNEAKNYSGITELTNKTLIDTDATNNWLYTVPYYPECIAELEQFKNQYHFYDSVDWNDPVFLAQVRTLISPTKKLILLTLPTNRLCVAVHIRKGGGYDAQPILDGGSWHNDKGTPADVAFPLKFPPDSFYIEQLRNISTFFKHAPLYVYIFTDDQNSQRLADKYTRELGLANIIFDYRKTGNAHNAHVLEDFFSMMQFDVLIRSESSFSLVASRLARGQLVIYPLTANYLSNAKWTNEPLKITQYTAIKTKG